jgi:hypothetical protein
MVLRTPPQSDWMLTIPGSGDPSSIITVPERKIDLDPPLPAEEPVTPGEVVITPLAPPSILPGLEFADPGAVPVAPPVLGPPVVV